MFAVHFLDIDDPKPISGPSLADADGHETRAGRGRITLGSFSEHFESPLGFWQKDDYRRHWRAALSRLIAGSRTTALITAMYDPATATFLTWWPLYEEHHTVFVQNQLLFLEESTMPFSIEAMDAFVPPRKTVNEDGMKISEWSIPLADVKYFLRHPR